MLQLIEAGIESYDVFTKTDRYVGLIAKRTTGGFAAYYNSNATRGSKRKFASVEQALNYLAARREKRAR